MTTTGRKRGAPRKPTEVKRAEGNKGHRQLPPIYEATTMPAVGENLPPVPASLDVDGVETWNHIWDAGRLWLNPATDRLIVLQICETIDETSFMRRAINTGEVPRLYKMGNGALTAHPYVKGVAENRKLITSWLIEIGFTAAARDRMGVGETRQTPVEDEMDARRKANREAMEAEREKEAAELAALAGVEA